MSDMMESKINEEILGTVTGGIEEESVPFKVWPIKPILVRVTVPTLHCRYTPDGVIALDFKNGDVISVDGITSDGWYRTLINNPKGGTCYGFIYQEYTEPVN